MTELSKLKPAETLLITKGSNAEFKDLMKYSLMDLVLKQVLSINETTTTYKSGRRYKEQRIKYVTKGRNFEKYEPSPFEQIYLSPFIKSPEIKAIFSKLIKVAYDAVSTEKKYRNSIISSHPYPSAFKRNFIHQIFGGFNLSTDGHRLRSTLINQLDEIDQNIGSLLQNNQKEALALLSKIGGNIFLLKNVDFELIRNIDTSIFEAMKADEKYDLNIWWYYFDFSNDYYVDFDSTFNSFESDFNSAGCSTSGSGCSSCSGCSGCGGCGGCS